MDGVPCSSSASAAAYSAASFAAPSSAAYAAALASHPQLAAFHNGNHSHPGSSLSAATTSSSSNGSSTGPENGAGNSSESHGEGGGSPNMSLILTIRLLMQGKEVGSIIGKRGEQIKMIREESGAKINISDGSCPERIVTITGSVQTINRAFEMVCNKFHEDLKALPNSVPKPPITMRMIIPATQCGSIIGKGGSKIKEIREATGASIQVASEMLPSSTERAVTLSGTAEAIILCMTHVCQILIEAPPKGVTLPYKPKPTYNPLLIASSAAATAAQQLAMQQQQAAYAALLQQPTSLASAVQGANSGSMAAAAAVQQYEQLARAQQQLAAQLGQAGAYFPQPSSAASLHQQQAAAVAFAVQQQQSAAALYGASTAGGLMMAGGGGASGGYPGVGGASAGYPGVGGVSTEEKAALDFLQMYGGGVATSVAHPAYAAMHNSLLFSGAPMIKAGTGPASSSPGASHAAGKAPVSTQATAVRYAPY